MLLRLAFVIVASLAVAPAAAMAQDVKSSELAKQLTQILDSKKLDIVAMADAHAPGTYFAVMYFPGTQLLVVSAKYAAPELLTELLARKDYRGVYAELTSASVAGSKLFVMDTFANGLTIKPSGTNPPDSVENGAVHTTFDGAWKKAKITEADYLKSFADADAAYARVLQGLINHLKASGT